ncbi:MAG: hypothetical protein OSJ76_01770 [Alphaproteobacteria bacterium]|nr:hypothetical protein [Alphaproteobacteria bacterium]
MMIRTEITWQILVDEETDRKFGISFDDFTTVSKLTAKGCSLSQIQHIMRQQRNFQTKH